MVTVLDVAVLLLLVVPVQPLICQPLSAAAPLRVIVSPATYSPAEQPVELVGLAVGVAPLPVAVTVSA